MLNARQLWKKRRTAKQSLDRVRKLVEKKLLGAEAVEHQSGVQTLDIDVPVSELKLSKAQLKKFISELQKLGYTASLKSREGWEVEGEEEPYYLSVTTFEK